MTREDRNYLNKQKRRLQVRRNITFLGLTVAFLVLLAFFLFSDLFSFQSSAYEGIEWNKRYEEILVYQEDSLWSIAKEYCSIANQSVTSYVQEIKDLNGIAEETIYAGEYLVIPVYEAHIAQ